MLSALDPIPPRNDKTQDANEGNLDWTALRNHCLLTPIRMHDTGDGALVWLSLLGRCFSSSQELSEWAEESQRLVQALRLCRLRHGTAITSRMEQDSLWSAVIDCINARQKATGSSVPIDGMLARYVIGLASEKAPASASFFSGLTQLYKASRSEKAKSVRREWNSLLEVLQATDDSLTAHILSIQMGVCRDFAILADRIRKVPIVAARSAVTLKVLTGIQTAGHANAVVDSIAVAQDGADDTGRGLEVDAQNTADDGDQAPVGFTHGDSISEYIRRQAPFTARRIRLGLERKSSAPLFHVREIVQLAATEFRGAVDPTQQASACLLLLQLCIPVSTALMLSMKCQPGEDLWLDIRGRALRVQRSHMTGSTSRPEWFESTSGWCIPLPSDAADFLEKLFEKSHRPSFLADVFTDNEIDLKQLVNSHHQLLKRCSDTNLQIWPGQWIDGVCTAAVQVLGSELSAAFLLSLPGLSAQGALHYFHPRQADLNNLARKWFGHFGLEEECDEAELQEIDIFGNDRLSSGFKRLAYDIQTLQSAIMRSRGKVEDVLPTYQDLVKRVAAVLVFVTASRGLKLDELKNGSLLVHDQLIHIEDKDVVDGRGSRLIPRPHLLGWVMKIFVDVQRTVAARLCDSNAGYRTDALVELSKADLRFDAVCFQYFKQRSRMIERVAVVAADIESISREYFSAPRNFMRHVLISHWTLAGHDPTVLRALTGHAWAWAEAPGPCSTYSPESLILAIKDPLEKLLGIWIERPPAVHRHSTWPPHRLPLRRMLKVQGYYRKFVVDGVQGPVLSRWHLAAAAFSDSVRSELVSGELPLSPGTQLWLFLAFVDGLTEDEDLDAILANPTSITRGPRGWTARWARPSDRTAARCMGLQAPTALLMEELQREGHAIDPAVVDSELTGWLGSRHPSLISKNRSPVPANAICLSAASLWSDLVLPTSNQTAYSVVNNAPIASRKSAESLIDGTLYHAHPISYTGPRPLPPRQHGSQLQRLIKLIHRTGDNNQRLGEQKSRAVYFLDHLNDLGSLEDGSWPSIMASAIQLNIELIRRGSRKALQFSSISTYTSAVSDFLFEHEDLDLKEVDDLEIKLLSKQLLAHARKTDEDSKTDVLSAAMWLLKNMSRQGYPVLFSDPALDDWHIRQRSAQTIPLIFEREISTARSLLASTHHDSPMEQEQLLVSLDLLLATPLRWMELATLNATHVLEQHQSLRIEASGFSHIKSSSSIRTLSISSELHARLQALSKRVIDLQRSSRPLLFSKFAPTSDTTTIPMWLRHQIVWVMKYVIEDDFRVRHFRSNATANLLFPRWRNIYENWTNAKASGAELGQLFEYTRARARHAEQVAVVAGHSHPVVTVCYYLLTWPFLRSLAMAALNSRLTPGPRFVARHGVSETALVKAGQRNEAISTNRWNYLVSKKFGYAKPACPVTLNDPPTHTPQQFSKDDTPASIDAHRHAHPTGTRKLRIFRYLCLRTCGVSNEQATDFTEVGRSDSHRLETYLAAISAHDIEALRTRDGKSSGERSVAAEIRLIQSDSFTRIFDMLALARPTQLRCLLGLLAFRHNAHQQDEESLIEVSKLFDGSPYVLEVIFGQRHFEPTLAARLSNTTSLKVGQPVRDLGRSAKCFIVARDQATNLVIKSRLRSIATQLCFHLQKLNLDPA